MLPRVGASLASAGLVCSGRYRLLDRLGEGGFGVVWAATDERSGREVALKFLKSTAALDPNSQRRFRREAQAAARIRHPNVVSILDVTLGDSGELAIVMERLRGETLRSLLSRKARLTPNEIAELFEPVLSAVAAAHAAGIVHRDLKPENIFLCVDELQEETVKLLDFSLAKVASKLLESQSLGLTASGAMLGTPYYMSPEQVFGECDVDHRTDIWALGVTLYECLSGVRPTDAANAGQVFKRITTHDITPLAEVASFVPAELAELIGRMLAANRAERPELTEIQQRLRGFSRVSGITKKHAVNRFVRLRARLGIGVAVAVLLGLGIGWHDHQRETQMKAEPKAQSNAAAVHLSTTSLDDTWASTTAPQPRRIVSTASARPAAAPASPPSVASPLVPARARKAASPARTAPAPSNVAPQHRPLDPFSDPL